MLLPVKLFLERKAEQVDLSTALVYFPVRPYTKEFFFFHPTVYIFVVIFLVFMYIFDKTWPMLKMRSRRPAFSVKLWGQDSGVDKRHFRAAMFLLGGGEKKMGGTFFFSLKLCLLVLTSEGQFYRRSASFWWWNHFFSEFFFGQGSICGFIRTCSNDSVCVWFQR